MFKQEKKLLGYQLTHSEKKKKKSPSRVLEINTFFEFGLRCLLRCYYVSEFS